MKTWLTMLLGALAGFSLLGMSLDFLVPPETRISWAERQAESAARE